METQQQMKDKTILGLQVSLSGDGSILTATGYDIEQDFGFIKVFKVSELFYVGCFVHLVRGLGNSACDFPPYNTEECGYDGGDCPFPSPVDGLDGCKVAYPSFIGDRNCFDALPYNSEACNYDGGDCLPPSPVEGYPNCFVSNPPDWIGDGNCDMHLPYNSVDCGFDGTDCLPSEFKSYFQTSLPTISQSPSMSPSISTEPSISTMPTTINVVVTLELRIDAYPSETSWSLVDNSQDDAIVHSNNGQTYGINSLNNFVWTLNRCSSYTSFTIYDAFGDGLISPGYDEVKTRSRLVEERFGRIYGNFGSHSTITFNICGTITPSPTLTPTLTPTMISAVATNVALYKSKSQSSDYLEFTKSEKAVDGIFSSEIDL